MSAQIQESTAPAPEEAVRERYSPGAQAAEAALCCPVSYDPRFLEAIPAEVLERDYFGGFSFVALRETILL